MYDVKALKKFIKEKYKAAFKNVVTDFIIYNRYRGKQFKWCSELTNTGPMDAYMVEPHGKYQWFNYKQPTDESKVKYAGFFVGFKKKVVTPKGRINPYGCMIYMHIKYDDNDILATCFEQFNDYQYMAIKTDEKLQDFAKAFK